MSGEVFVWSQNNSVIYGRISFDESPEIIYFPTSAQPKLIKVILDYTTY